MERSSRLDAFINGLRDGGCEFVSNYPGTYSQDIFFKLGGDRISANEKVAFERAYGAALAGNRSVVSMKNVGLNACADPYLHSVITGVNGGFVVVVTDDTKVTGSQEREDSRHFIDFFGGLWIEPHDAQSAYQAGYEAFELSERFDIPVTIRLTSQFFESDEQEYVISKQQKSPRKQKASAEKMIAYPIYWKRQADNLEKKREAIAHYVNGQYTQRTDVKNSTAVLSIGANFQEISSLDKDRVDILQITHYPLPFEAIRTFTKGRDEVRIIEQGDTYASEKILASIAEEVAPFKIISDSGTSPDLDHQWKIWDHLERMFVALKNIQPSFVVGDVGQYTVETQHVVDACLCLGSSVGVALGVAEANNEYPYCVVGDGSFLHSNTLALQEAVTRLASFGLIIIDNGGSMATGGQPLVASVRQNIPSGIQVYDINYEESSIEDFQTIFENMRKNNSLSIAYVTLEAGKR